MRNRTSGSLFGELTIKTWNKSLILAHWHCWWLSFLTVYCGLLWMLWKNALCCYKITTSFYVLLVKPSIRSHSGVTYWPAGQPFPTDLGSIIQWVNKGVSSKTPRKTLSNRLQQIHLAVQFRMGMKATNSKWGYVKKTDLTVFHISIFRGFCQS